MAMFLARLMTFASVSWLSISLRPELASRPAGLAATGEPKVPSAIGQDSHAGLLSIAEHLEADPSSAGGLKDTIEPMLLDLEKEMQHSHKIAQTEINALFATFSNCTDRWETEKGKAAVPDGNPHSTCRQGEVDAKQQYDACHNVQVTLETAKTSACNVWHAARDKPASKDTLPEVMPGETLLAYIKRLQDFAEQEMAQGNQLETACATATESHASKRMECEGEGGGGGLKKEWLDKQGQCIIEQGLFETASCSYTQQVEAACGAHANCFDQSMGVWKAETAPIKEDAESRKASYEMIQRIRCLLEVFTKAGHHHDVDQAEVDKCKAASHDQPQFHLPIPADPAQPEECPLLPKPCSKDWTDAEYTSHPDAPLAACTPCAPAQKSFEVLSVDHVSNREGLYFNFDISSASEALGRPLVSGEYQVTELNSGWSGEVLIWTHSNGSSLGDGHGRRNGGQSPGQWHVGDKIVFEHDPTPSESPRCDKPTCGINGFCLGFEPDDKIYCYGSSTGCLWNSNDCTNDQDCSKYSASSPKYTDGGKPRCDWSWRGSGWGRYACMCGTPPKTTEEEVDLESEEWFPRCMKPKCGKKNVCVAYETDNNVYCYGSMKGCLWNRGDCTTDQDCNKYSASSMKFTDGGHPRCDNTTKPGGWHEDACTCS